MPTTAAQAGAAAESLARHLRAHPESALRPPDELAAEIGVSPEFVAEVLAGIRGIRAERVRESRPGAIEAAKRGVDRLRAGFRVVTDRPIAFVFVTLALAIVGSVMLWRLEKTEQVTGAFGKPLMTHALLLIGVLGLHLACYYRHARVRVALLGGLVVWLTLAPSVMTLAWFDMPNGPSALVIGKLLTISVQMLILCAQYTLLGVGAAVIGGLVWTRRRERHSSKLTRQELLQRLFEIRERLSQAGEAPESPEKTRMAKIAKAFRGRWPLWCAASGVAFSGLYMPVLLWLGGPLPTNPSRIPMLALAMAMFFLFELVLLAGIGYLAGNLWLAFAGVFLYQLASLVPMTMPIEGFGAQYVIHHYGNVTAVIALAAYTSVVCLVSALGARVQERLDRERRFQANEPAALLAELVRIEWLLSPKTTEVCILSVDAAKSSEMKANADPLVVEFCFRQYQELIRSVCDGYGGHVHSTAGDGAVVAFGDPAEAFSAARRILAEIEQFNRHANRLQAPFRLRIGLHVGTIAGTVDQVQFTEVIDVAAHVQSSAPIGGITVTENVMVRLPGERLAPLQDPIDGHRVWLALDPAMDL